MMFKGSTSQGRGFRVQGPKVESLGFRVQGPKVEGLGSLNPEFVV